MTNDDFKYGYDDGYSDGNAEGYSKGVTEGIDAYKKTITKIIDDKYPKRFAFEIKVNLGLCDDVKYPKEELIMSKDGIVKLTSYGMVVPEVSAIAKITST